MTILTDLIRALLMPLLRWWLHRRFDAYFTPERISAIAWQMFADEMFHWRYR